MLNVITSHRESAAYCRPAASALVRNSTTRSEIRTCKTSASGAPPRATSSVASIGPPARMPRVPVPCQSCQARRLIVGIHGAVMKPVGLNKASAEVADEMLRQRVVVQVPCPGGQYGRAAQ
jgi:hypothetical protein